ncbi:MAG: PD40 domain-containing protein [Verrucomicrobia bacterium]|nr:PD40 domain-containing protein [Verrucomicrobiota bacterium]
MKTPCILSLSPLGLALTFTVFQAVAQPAGYFAAPRLVPGPMQLGQFDFSQHVTPDHLTIIFNSNGTLYQATRSSRDQPFGNVKPLGPTINTSGFEETGPTLTADGRVLVFQRDPPGPTDNASPENDLFEARRASVGEPFGVATPLPDAINRYSAFTPHLSPDGLMLLFGSTRPGGKGNEDIWVATRASRDEPFGAPVNFNDFFAGSQVNSTYGEVAPSLSWDGLALFVSEGDSGWRPGGRGGPDIWVSTRPSNGEPFGRPVNLNAFAFGSSVNTSGWEGYIFLSRDWPGPGSKLYFSANRAGGFTFDFWEAEWVPFRMSSVTLSWGAAVSLTAKAGLLIDVQYRENLNSGGWTSVRGRLVAQADSLEVYDVRSEETRQAFYRAVIPDEAFAQEIAGSYLGTVPELKLQVLVKLGADGTTVRVSDADRGLNGQSPFASRTLASGTWTQTGLRRIRLVETGFEFDPKGLPVPQWQVGKAVMDLEFSDSQTASGPVQAWAYADGNDPLSRRPANVITLGSVQLRRIR